MLLPKAEIIVSC